MQVVCALLVCGALLGLLLWLGRKLLVPPWPSDMSAAERAEAAAYNRQHHVAIGRALLAILAIAWAALAVISVGPQAKDWVPGVVFTVLSLGFAAAFVVVIRRSRSRRPSRR